MDLGLEGKVALVAAATRGIGLATAQALAREGARVSICGLNEERLKEAQALLGDGHRAYRCDLARAKDIEKWVSDTKKDLGEPSIVVTNTGGPPAGVAGALTEAQWQAGFESTVLNVVRLVALTSEGMKKAGWGRIVHVTSLVAKDPDPMLAISSTLRAGLSSLCRLQARELGPDGITVNCVLPGHTDTDRQRHLLELRAKQWGTSVDAERNRAQGEIPLKRFARPAEIADAIAFLCSNRAAYVTGTSLLVDGGFARGLA